MLTRVAVFVLAAACRGDTAAPNAAPRGTAVGDATHDGAGANPGVVLPPDVSGAIPAWQAVVDRAIYLERRGSVGIVRGVIGPKVTPFVWLVDETEGTGSLAIRVLLPSRVAVAPGDRIAVAGAWSWDESSVWYWRASRVTALPSAKTPVAMAAPAPDGKDSSGCKECADAARGVTTLVPLDHSITDGDMPPNARPINLAKQGDPAYFSVVGDPPILDGDGWLVAAAPRSPPYALVNMPGERASFGGQDFRAPSERWTLQRGETYWVRIGPVRRRAADRLATINARTPPVRVTRPLSQTGR